MRIIWLFRLSETLAHVTITRRNSKENEKIVVIEGELGMPEISVPVERILSSVSAIRCSAADSEAVLHARVAEAFESAEIPYVHEARLAPRCRIDFLVGKTGIEIKKRRPERSKLMVQLTRYAACAQIEYLIVLAPRGVNLPDSICGKKVKMISLERLWGISLP